VHAIFHSTLRAVIADAHLMDRSVSCVSLLCVAMAAGRAQSKARCRAWSLRDWIGASTVLGHRIGTPHARIKLSMLVVFSKLVPALVLLCSLSETSFSFDRAAIRTC